jgi:hypothetical protein
VATHQTGDEKMEKTYTITVTYEAQITTTANQEDIENGLWLGDLEIGTLGLGGRISVRGDAVDYEVQEE